jgi:hypothetical protein
MVLVNNDTEPDFTVKEDDATTTNDIGIFSSFAEGGNSTVEWTITQADFDKGVEGNEFDDDNPTAYIIKAVAIDGDQVIYELVDEEDELEAISPRFDEILEQSDFEVE